MRYTIYIVLFSWLMLHANISSAQHYLVTHISTKNGLPNNSVQDIFKDREDNVWIGTNAGLCKYDGKKTHVYSGKDGLSGNYIWGIAQDKQGLLWLATYDNGICSFDGRQFTPLVLNDSISKRIRCVVYDNEDDILLFGTDHGLIIKDGDSIQYFNGKSLGISSFQVIAIQKIGSVYFVYPFRYEDTYCYNPKDRSLQKYAQHNKRGFKNISAAVIDNHGDTILGYKRNNTAVLMHNKILDFPHTGQLFEICRGANDEVWLAGWDISLRGETGGLFQLKNNKLTDYTEKLQLGTRLVWSLYYDSLENTLFVGTNDKGLYIYKNKIFEYFDLGQSSIQINYLKHIDKKLWIATDHGLLAFQNGQIIESYDKEYFARVCKRVDSLAIKRFYASQQTKLATKYVNTDSEGNLYVSTGGGFFRCDAPGQFSYQATIWLPFVFDAGKLWAVGWGQLYEFDSDDLTKLTLHNYRREGTPVDIAKIVEHDDKLWFLSFYRGLFLKDGNKFKHLNKTNKLLDNQVNDLVYDDKGNIYIAQNNGTVLVAQYKNDSLVISQVLSCGSELHGNVVKWLAWNKQNQLFVGTDLGLNYINLNNFKDSIGQFRFFDTEEGYSASESMHASVDSLGNVWVDTDEGLLKINAKYIDEAPLYHPLRITKIELYNRAVDSLLHISKPKLKYDQNYLSFSFKRGNYLNANKDKCFYRLVGLSDKWRISSDNQVDFFDLSPGKYSFEVKCFNSDAARYCKMVQYDFVIKKPWWNTILFYVVISLIVIILISIYVRIKVKQINKEANERLAINKKIADLEMQALQSQMNPHFIFNSINAIQNFVLDGDIDETLTYISHFSRLLRSTLNYASEKYISINEELQYLKHYLALEKMRFSNAFEVEINVDPKLDPNLKIMPPMLLQPIIENAIKHGQIHRVENGKISIEIKADADYLICTITDNGVGREKASKKTVSHHASKAMHIIEDRIKLLSNEDEAGIQLIDLEQGTQVILRIKLVEDALM